MVVIAAIVIFVGGERPNNPREGYGTFMGVRSAANKRPILKETPPYDSLCRGPSSINTSLFNAFYPTENLAE